MRRLLLISLLTAGAVVAPAVGALGASAQLIPTTTTTITVPLLTTTTTESPATTTTTEAPPATTTTTTESPATTTTTAAPATTTTTGSPATTSTTSVPGPPANALSISVPSSSSLSEGTPLSAGLLSAELGEVTVTDHRGAVNGAWTVTVTSTDFTTGFATAAETIDRGQVAYTSGAPRDTGGIGVFTPGQALHAEDLSIPRTAFSMAGGIGDNTVKWTPTIIVIIPPSAVAGTYTGTITHSAA